MRDGLHFTEASAEAHYEAISRIYARGWHRTYPGAVPQDYLDRVITDDHWVADLRRDCAAGAVRGLLLYRGDEPVACCTYGPARSEGYEGWGELHSFYAHPDHTGEGYGGLLMEEALRRLRSEGFRNCYVLVLRENEGARRFYAAHGFRWDGTHVDIPFPPDALCVDLRYTQSL